jgi:chemotaxis protein CheX
MTDFSETEFKVFIEAVTHYFAHQTQMPAQIRASYLTDPAALNFDYTGLITLAGRFRGCVYFTAPGRMLRELLRALHEPDVHDDNLLDAVGEIANTIAGNVRRHFGAALEISVPIKIRGTSTEIKSAVRSRPFAILIGWQRHEAAVVIDLEPVA